MITGYTHYSCTAPRLRPIVLSSEQDADLSPQDAPLWCCRSLCSTVGMLPRPADRSRPGRNRNNPFSKCSRRCQDPFGSTCVKDILHHVGEALYLDQTTTDAPFRPAEANTAVVPANVGVTASSVRALLVVLATVLDADVPQGSDNYLVNANNTVTVDFIQTNRIALPEVQVREIHSFDPHTCQITKIVGYVNGPVTAVTGGLDLPSILQGLLAGLTVDGILGGLGDQDGTNPEQERT